MVLEEIQSKLADLDEIGVLSDWEATFINDMLLLTDRGIMLLPISTQKVKEMWERYYG